MPEFHEVFESKKKESDPIYRSVFKLNPMPPHLLNLEYEKSSQQTFEVNSKETTRTKSKLQHRQARKVESHDHRPESIQNDSGNNTSSADNHYLTLNHQEMHEHNIDARQTDCSNLGAASASDPNLVTHFEHASMSSLENKFECGHFKPHHSSKANTNNNSSFLQQSHHINTNNNTSTNNTNNNNNNNINNIHVNNNNNLYFPNLNCISKHSSDDCLESCCYIKSANYSAMYSDVNNINECTLSDNSHDENSFYFNGNIVHHPNNFLNFFSNVNHLSNAMPSCYQNFFQQQKCDTPPPIRFSNEAKAENKHGYLNYL